MPSDNEQVDALTREVRRLEGELAQRDSELRAARRRLDQATELARGLLRFEREKLGGAWAALERVIEELERE